jgi:hypothetical protein
LCHLYTLSDEISDPEALLHNFVPLLLKCAKSPAMKNRIFISKSIATIVNLDRYSNLINDILDNYLLNDLNDNNKLHGILQILIKLADKNKIFNFVLFNKFSEALNLINTNQLNQ